MHTVIFDYAEVLAHTRAPDVADRFLDLAEVGEERFWHAWWRHRWAYNLGGSADEFWSAVSEELGAGWDDATRHQLWATDMAGCLRPLPETLRVVQELADRGVRLALLSDAPADLAELLRRSPALAPFESLYFSCDLGVCKPDPNAFEQVLADLGAPAEGTWFIDDRGSNVDAARALGLRGHRFEDADALRSDLDPVLAG
ncbi:HAD family phosphatase [Nocardiopsis sp. HNM0947]|uniref:HAD family phosphatase n=1 Tax=Nocardiopsis coralli TaxID=2772213 RepID=A0ABR9P0R7_9ACTN|nr:HAD family phosphatase [Nocardiopsis coralli]MBE2997417.1 HAD family phosphatase [Nocardiopsis coralli]